MASAPVEILSVPPAADWLLLAPSVWLAAWGLVLLLVDVSALRHSPVERRARVLGLMALFGSLVALALGGMLLVPGALGVDATTDTTIFGGTLASDLGTTWLNLFLLALLVLLVGVSLAWTFTDALGEYYALLLWATVGAMLLLAAEELLTLFLGMETMTLCLYMMTGLERGRRRSAEGALKYFLYGSVATALFLFGLSLVYGLTGTTRLPAVRLALAGTGTAGLSANIAGALAVLLLLAGFGFKIAAFPFHQWAPEAYEGAPAPVAGWIASGSEMASFVAMMKVLLLGLGPWATDPARITTPGWVGILAVLAAASMTYGNLAALGQRNFKRLLAYSSIAHAGYVLVGVLAAAVSVRRDQAAGAVLFYVVTYAFTTLGAFAAATWLARDTGSDAIEDLDGLGWRRPVLAACLLVLMLSLVGLPPLAGFMGKLAMFMEALNAGETGRLTLTWLVGLALLNSVVSAFYYVRVLKAMFLREPRAPMGRQVPRGIAVALAVGAVVVLVFGISPNTLLEPLQGAASAVLTATGLAPADQVNNRYATAPDPVATRKAIEERNRTAEERKRRLTGSSPGGGGEGGGGGRRGRRRPGGEGAPPAASAPSTSTPANARPGPDTAGGGS